MLLLYVTVSCVLFGGSSADVSYEEECYGRRFKLPYIYSPPIFHGQMYFTPSNGGSTKLVMDNGVSTDPRLKVSLASVQFKDLTERDEGIFSVSYDGDTTKQNIVKLRILDCAEKITKYYGDMYSCNVPRQAEFLEFTPHSVDQPKVLWNRTHPQANKGGRGQVKRSSWVMYNLKQADMGHYNFRAKDNTLLSRISLEVKAHIEKNDKMENEWLLIRYPSSDIPWTVAFTPEGEVEKQTLVMAGHLVIEDNWLSERQTLLDRTQIVNYGMEINPLKTTDSGTFEFIDEQGYLARTVILVVNEEPDHTFVYVGIAVGVIFAVFLCCCCVKKCCCKKSSSKGDETAPHTAAAPAVYCHDPNQPAGQSYSAAPAPKYSYQPMNSLASREHTIVALEPSVYNTVNIHVNSLQPEDAPVGGQGVHQASTLGSDFLSSDPGPRFELRGLLSAPPLSAESNFLHVYTSDKLNFL